MSHAIGQRMMTLSHARLYLSLYTNLGSLVTSKNTTLPSTHSLGQGEVESWA